MSRQAGPPLALIGLLVSGAAVGAFILCGSAAPPISDLVRFERAAQRMGTSAMVNLTKLPHLKPAAGLAVGDYGAPLVAACFAEGTPQSVVDAFRAAMGYDQGPVDRWGENGYVVPDPEDGDGDVAYHTGPRWSGTQGSHRALTWSFVPDGLVISGANGEPSAPSTLFASLDAAYSAQGGRATWVLRFQQIFDRWQAIGGTSYTRITTGGHDWDDGAAWGTAGAAGARGDIRISMHPIDGASNVLAYTFYPSNGDMVFDSGDAGNYASATNLNRFLRNTAAHEHGHGFGLAHTCSNNSNILMEPFLSTSFDGPRQDDFRAIQRHYGDPYEADNSAGGSSDLGTLTPGTPITPCTAPNPISGTNDATASICSIDADGESDWFKFTVANSVNASVTVTPKGTTYQDNDESVCNANPGTSTNALLQADLAVQIISTDGVTILGTADVQPAGVAETLTNILLPAAGSYYVKVYEEDAPTQTQLYTFSLTATNACVGAGISGQPSSQTICSGGSVTFTVTGTGTAPLSYQWRKNTVNIGGATSSSYNINPVNTGDAGNYDVIVSNACGSATSNAAVLTVNVAPSISVQPTNQTVCSGGSATFSVTASGTPAPTYQWRKNTVNIGGATSSSYNINPVNPSHAGNYDVVVTNSCGSVTSNAASLTVNVAPSITIQPTNQSASLGGSATFSVTATGTPAPTYQWRKAGVNISGETASSYTINPVQAGDAGTYDVVITNSCGSIDSNDVTLTINGACNPCDVNCDGSINQFDITPFVAILAPSPPPPCSPCAGDANGDGSINQFDINAFITCLTGP